MYVPRVVQYNPQKNKGYITKTIDISSYNSSRSPVRDVGATSPVNNQTIS